VAPSLHDAGVLAANRQGDFSSFLQAEKIEGVMTELTAGDGQKLSASRVDPREAPKGAVVVVQEVFGINPHIRKMADQFAAEAYVAIAPALFDRVKPGVRTRLRRLPSTKG
jgi:hypothetical protein